MLLCALNSDFVTGITGLVYIQIRSYDCEVSAEKLTYLELNKSTNTHNDLTLVAIEHIHHQTRDTQSSKKSPPGETLFRWGRVYFPPLETLYRYELAPPENLYRYRSAPLPETFRPESLFRGTGHRPHWEVVMMVCCSKQISHLPAMRK